MKLVLLGPPGAGKGTQAVKISQRFAIPHISTGDIFRKNLREETPLGLLAKSYMDQGLLVPDAVTIDLVIDRIAQEDCAHGFLLDGFPRTLTQAVAFDAKVRVDRVLNIDVPQEVLMARLTGRRTCGACGAIHHISTLQGSGCPCGGELTVRTDDQPEAVAKRLEVYREQTHPLVAYYQQQGTLSTLDGTLPIDELFGQIEALLEGLA